MSLSSLRPDFDDIVQQLTAKLSQYESWNGILTTDTGQHITEYFATISAFNQLATESAYQEVNSGTAKQDSSIRAIVRSLGTRMTRKLPAQVEVKLTRDGTIGSYTIPAYSRFATTSGVSLFNRDPISFDDGSDTPVYAAGKATATLYEGAVYNTSLTSTGDDYWQFRSSESQFAVSDIDVLLSVNAVSVELIRDGLWHYPNSTPLGPRRVAWDTTISTGEMLIVFGSDLFGYKLQTTDLVEVVYVITKGSAGNDDSFHGDLAKITLDTVIGGLTIADISVPDVYDDGTELSLPNALRFGADEVPISTYRAVAPQLYASFQRAVTRDDHAAIAMSYPGMADCLVQGQAELAPALKEYMNVAKITTLKADGSSFSISEFNDFKTWFKERSLYNMELLRNVPVAYPIDIEMTVFCEVYVDLNVAKTQIENAISEMFTPRFKIMGSRLFRSDFINAAYYTVRGVKHVQLTAPTYDVSTKAESPVIRGNFIPAGVYPSIPAGNATYTVTATAPYVNESLVSNVLVVPYPSDAGTYAVQLTWQPTIGATGYRVYGRGTTGRKMIGQIDTPLINQFTDAGDIIPGTNYRLINATGAESLVSGGVADEPTLNVSQIAYPVLGNLSVTTKYIR